MPALENDRYPVGRFERLRRPLDVAARAALTDAIEKTPETIRSLVEPLHDRQLDSPYREGGWTIRQVVHHVPDSHMNAYIRMKLAATEETPVIKPYDEGRWAELPDGRSAPISMSLDLLDALHRRWVTFLRSLSDDQLHRTFVHPELGPVAIGEALALYAWHGRHHAAHIRNAISR
jgi:uncharacterized damage-inducible protein DinB